MFYYKNKILVLKQGQKVLPVQNIVKDQKQPFYLYDLQGLKDWYDFFLKATENQLEVFFAMKANFNKQILKAFQQKGCGLDIVSGGEARLAQSLGFEARKVVFSGIGKTEAELTTAIKKQFFQVNVESFEELKRIAEICKTKNKSCAIGLRINPNIDFVSHPYIKTGLKGHKFGFEEEELPELLKFIQKHKQICLQGLSMHLGSQIFDLDPLFKAILYLKDLYRDLKKEKQPLKVLDIGGGLGINYQKADFEEEKTRLQLFGKTLKKILKGFEGKVITEPGRFLIARFGILCSQVEYVKKSPSKKFVILNSGMNHFLRPALYGAKHRILPMKQALAFEKYDVVGPICETGDTFAKNCPLPKMHSGDWLAIADTGAYGFVMANSYNLQLPVKEICFDKGQLAFH